MEKRERLFRKKYRVDEASGCWLWTAGTNQGYGWFYQGPGRGAGNAHRWAYEHFVGPVPADHDVHHTCENRRCVNPEHLKAIPARRHTKLHNRQGGRRGRTFGPKTHCKRGHEFTEKNTYHEPGGVRRCRQCTLVRQRRRYWREKRRAS